jgi:4-hydroxybutyrate CoA-transferase
VEAMMIWKKTTIQKMKTGKTGSGVEFSIILKRFFVTLSRLRVNTGRFKMLLNRFSPIHHLQGFRSSNISKCFHQFTKPTLKEPFAIRKGMSPKVFTTPEDAISPFLHSNMNIYVHMAASTPTLLLEGMTNVALSNNYQNISAYHMHIEGPIPHVTNENARRSFRDKSFFVGSNLRGPVNSGQADYIPIFFSEVPSLFRSGRVPLDICLVQVSEPDQFGFVSLGPGVCAMRGALEASKFIIAIMNKNVPRVFGDGDVHISNLDSVIYSDKPLYHSKVTPPSKEDVLIGDLVANNLVQDGATLQVGIGGIPNAILSSLRGHKNLGIHTEMMTDGIIPLIEEGVITNGFKHKQRGKTVAGFAYGSVDLYKWMHDNPSLQMMDISYVNDVAVIRAHPKMTALNSCIEIDITGQIVSDSIGSRIYSGIGGQMDFIRGAAVAEGGVSIIAINSTTSKGDSKIVSTLKPGAGVVTTRGHVRYVVTEFGIVDLFGKSTRDRATALISVAHPSHRDRLMREAREVGVI